jgi:hypothetical protein
MNQAPLADPLAPGFARDLSSLALPELRRRRAIADGEETGYSYLRRLVQGRLDIVVDERAHRSGATPSSGEGDLVGRLPTILGGGIHAPGRGRLPQHLDPGEIDPGLERRLDEIVTISELSDPPAIGDRRLSEIVDALAQFEREISATRRSLQEVCDAISAEVVRRYQSGEVSTDSLP